MTRRARFNSKKGTLLFLSLIIVLGGASAAFADRIEKAGEIAPAVITENAKKSPLQVALHSAREAGDLDRVLGIEKQISEQASKNGVAGEQGTRFIQPKSTSVFSLGDPALKYGGGPQSQGLLGPSQAVSSFGQEIFVRAVDGSSLENNQTLAADSNGNLYVAWQDDFLSPDYIQLYWSQDGGLSWQGFANVSNSGAQLRNPSLTIGEGTEDLLVLAYIVDDGVNTPYPEIATTPLGVWSFTFSNPPIVSGWESYEKPVVWTDSVDFSGWYLYLTAEGVFDSSVDNINVVTWRSTDRGDTWSSHNTVLGNTDTDAWTDPDGTYGTTGNDPFICCYNATDDNLYYMSSFDFGQTYNTEVAVTTVPGDPSFREDPMIAAAVNQDNLMIACTYHNGSNNEIGYIYSQDSGGTWTSFFILPGSSGNSRFVPEMIAGENGQSWHMVYTSGNQVYYSSRPQNLSGLWTTPVPATSSTPTASASFPKKGIACNFTTDQAYVVWADFRDGVPDYDTYFSFSGSLVGDNYQVLDAVGGTSNLTLDAGSGNANRNYIIVGSVSGMSGIPLPGGLATLPLTYDFYTNLTINLTNTVFFQNFSGQLDGSGEGSATLFIPANSGAAGITLYFAYGLNGPWNFASNAIAVNIN